MVERFASTARERGLDVEGSGPPPAERIRVYHGSNDLRGGGQVRAVREKIVHEEHRNATGGHDIALLRLAQPFQDPRPGSARRRSVPVAAGGIPVGATAAVRWSCATASMGRGSRSAS
jgi:hypothetical protein